MSTISCSSCGMEYDGTGLQAGVQFQCTQCGSMVQVGAPARAAAPVGARPRGGTRGPARGPARGPGRAAPMGSPQQQMQNQQAQQPAYGPPRSGSNTGLFVGLGVGAVVLVLIIVVVVASSGSSPEETQKTKAEQDKKQREDQAAADKAKITAENEAIKKPMDAAMDQASAVDSALRAGDAKALESMFDWQVYAAYNKTLIDNTEKDKNGVEKGKAYLNNPLFAAGRWEKGEDGRFTGMFIGEAAHGPDSLRTRVMDYIGNFLFGAQELRWDREKTEHEKGAFSMEVGGTKYLGKKVYITYKGAKAKEFWLGAPKGSADVRILNYYDSSAMENLKGVEAKNERVDDRDLMRDPIEPRDPSDPRDPEDPEPDEPRDPDGNLPAAAKTGAAPTLPELTNVIADLKRGNQLNVAKTRTIEQTSSKVEKKATMGAMIDLLIDALKNKDRTLKTNVSLALWEVWGPFVPTDWKRKDMVYEADFGGDQSESDLVVRRWLEIYNGYKTE